MVRITFKGDFTKWTGLDSFALLIRNHIRDSFSLPLLFPSLPKKLITLNVCARRKEGTRENGGRRREGIRSQTEGGRGSVSISETAESKKQASFTTPLPGDHLMVKNQSIHRIGTTKMLFELKTRNLC